VDEIFTRLDRPDPTATHLHTYSVRYRRAEELVDGILEALGETEREQVSLVVPRKANLILIRATDSVYLKIESSLKTLDVPSKKRVKSAE
jgi:type II secretory pathway component GspD/PulD (secretin)